MAVVSTRADGSSKLWSNMTDVEAFLVAIMVDVLCSVLWNVSLSLLVLKLLVLILSGVTTARAPLLVLLLDSQSLVNAESAI
jgi:hypothetical protein